MPADSFPPLPLTLEGPLGSFLNGSWPSAGSLSFTEYLTKWEAGGKSRVVKKIHGESAGGVSVEGLRWVLGI